LKKVVFGWYFLGGQFKSATHGQFKSAQGGQFDRNLQSVYLKKEISKLDSKSLINTHAEIEEFFDSKMFWTDSKIAAIELIYALHSSKSINRGQVDIKDIAAVFERGLHIQLGDLYRAFIEIQIRKKDRTKFLDTLKDGLIQRMDEAFE
jgi:hypothetical protein